MKVQPKHDYRCAAHSMPPLDKNKVYKAMPATNQPYYEEFGLVFVEGFLLNKIEYKIVLNK